MNPTQERLLKLFKEIHDICIKNDIIYYMAGGTLIGVLRHEGFIPWDDDLDILMTRGNWEKFVEVTRTGLPQNRVLDCQELDRNYPNLVGRYVDVSATSIRPNQIAGLGEAGFMIDILILDPIPDKEDSYIKYRENVLLYSDLVNPHTNYGRRFKVDPKKYSNLLKLEKKLGRDAALKELEKDMYCYSEEDCDYYVMRWGGIPFIFEKDMYGSSRWGVFEGIKCRIPDRTGDYLTWHYGDDWMYIPPHDEQETHEGVFEVDIGYKKVQDDYIDFINTKKAKKIDIKIKKNRYKKMLEEYEYSDKLKQARLFAVKVELENTINNCGFDIFKAYENNEYDKLNNVFEDYYSIQLSRTSIGREDFTGAYRFNNPIFAEIDDEVLYLAIMVLANTNKIAKAKRLIDIFETKRDISGKILEAKEFILKIRESISDYDLGRKDAAFEKVEKLYENSKLNKSINLFYIRLLLEKNEMVKAKNLINDSLEKFDENGEFYKCLGDYFYKLEEYVSALKEYSKSLDLNKNGYFYLEIKKNIKPVIEKILGSIKLEEKYDIINSLLKIFPENKQLLINKLTIEKDTMLFGDDEMYEKMQNLIVLYLNCEEKECVRECIKFYSMKLGLKEELSEIIIEIYSSIANNTIFETYDILIKKLDSEHLGKGDAFNCKGDILFSVGLVKEANENWGKAQILSSAKFTEISLRKKRKFKEKVLCI